jgi:hypothetical protein
MFNAHMRPAALRDREWRERFLERHAGATAHPIAAVLVDRYWSHRPERSLWRDVSDYDPPRLHYEYRAQYAANVRRLTLHLSSETLVNGAEDIENNTDYDAGGADDVDNGDAYGEWGGCNKQRRARKQDLGDIMGLAFPRLRALQVHVENYYGRAYDDEILSFLSVALHRRAPGSTETPLREPRFPSHGRFGGAIQPSSAARVHHKPQT